MHVDEEEIPLYILCWGTMETPLGPLWIRNRTNASEFSDLSLRTPLTAKLNLTFLLIPSRERKTCPISFLSGGFQIMHLYYFIKLKLFLSTPHVGVSFFPYKLGQFGNTSYNANNFGGSAWF